MSPRKKQKDKAPKKDDPKLKTETAQQEQPEDAKKTPEETPDDAQKETPEVSETDALKDELAQQKDRFLRLQAEYENYRRRSQTEMTRRYEDALVDVCNCWLPVLDNLDRAIEAAEKAETEEGKNIGEGVELVRRQALDVMKNLGVEEIPALGETFDPKWHEAVHHIEDDKYGENEISAVMKKGYRIGERVLRHAMVQVAN